VKANSNLNSGVQIRSQCIDEDKTVELDGKKIKIPAGRVYGYQVEIDPSDRAWTGGIYLFFARLFGMQVEATPVSECNPICGTGSKTWASNCAGVGNPNGRRSCC
jgi:hypothetical protein